MGDILEIIKSRRTIKHFLPKFVSWENIARILDAGRHAPSCGNVQNWKFIVCVDPEVKQNLAKASYEQYEIAMAGALIVVVAEPEKAERYYGLRGERLYTVQNCAAAIQNMLLEAHSLGLGTRWIGAFEEDTIRDICNIPENIRPQAIIAVGYPKEVPPKPPKYPLETVTYFHGWRHKMRDSAKYMHNYATIIGRKFSRAKEGLEKATSIVTEKAKEIIASEKKEENQEKSSEEER
jgi:nitroreductase